jgi:hypothetical protein
MYCNFTGNQEGEKKSYREENKKCQWCTIACQSEYINLPLLQAHINDNDDSNDSNMIMH